MVLPLISASPILNHPTPPRPLQGVLSLPCIGPELTPTLLFLARLLALRRSGTPARLLQPLRPMCSFGHLLDQAKRSPGVTDGRVVGARQLLALVSTPL